MTNELLGLIMDCVVLIFLGATIMYAYRLSKSLQDFRSHRSEFDSVIANLISSIDQAERAIRTLKNTSAQEASELKRLIDQSKSLSEELSIINAASESMAKRLERVAEENRKIVRPDKNDKISSPLEDYKSTLKKVSKPSEDKDLPSFMIHDKVPQNDDDLQSQAEKELLAALRSNKRKITRSGEGGPS